MILVVHLDDLLLIGDEQLIEQCKRELTFEFEMEDLGLIQYFVGLEVWQKLGEIFLTQGKYAVDILQRFGMQDCKSMSVPMTTNLTKLRDSATGSQRVDSTLYKQLIGSLMYLVHTRPDICYTVNALSQFMSNPKHIHWVAAKHVLRYVQGTITYGLMYTSNSGVLLAGYTGSD